MNSNYEPRPWMKSTLALAGAYNLVWGAVAVLFPSTMLGWLGVDATDVALSFWQCIGMIVGVYGIGYAIAARSPYRHWPITLVGLLGKLLGPMGFVVAVSKGVLPTSMFQTILLNDVIWWAPFAIILWGAARHAHAVQSAHEEPEADDPMRELLTNTGKRLDELADIAPQMVVFLRHAGCTFCRQALADIAAGRQQIEATGCEIVFVHLGQEDDDSKQVFQRYNLDDLPRISDPTCRLYRQFGLDLGGFTELFGLRVWLRGLLFGIVNGHGIGAVKGNSFQMPGVYLYHCGVILGGFRHEAASDRPDYVELAQQSR
ncbi:MAG: redoxin domain-containing protein [Pirellulaceae bacterium]